MKPSSEFIQAVQSRGIVFAASLIKQGANIQLKDKEGNSALHLAARNGDFDMVKMLVGNGADVLARNNQDKTPIGMVSPSKGDGIALTDDSFNRMLNKPAQDDLERLDAALLAYLMQQERLTSADREQKSQAMSEKVKKNQTHLKNRSVGSKFRL